MSDYYSGTGDVNRRDFLLGRWFRKNTQPVKKEVVESENGNKFFDLEKDWTRRGFLKVAGAATVGTTLALTDFILPIGVAEAGHNNHAEFFENLRQADSLRASYLAQKTSLTSRLNIINNKIQSKLLYKGQSFRGRDIAFGYADNYLLKGIQLVDMDLAGAEFKNPKTILQDSILSNVNLDGATFNEADFSGSFLNKVSFQAISINDSIKFRNSTIVDGDFRNIDQEAFAKIDFHGAKISSNTKLPEFIFNNEGKIKDEFQWQFQNVEFIDNNKAKKYLAEINKKNNIFIANSKESNLAANINNLATMQDVPMLYQEQDRLAGKLESLIENQNELKSKYEKAAVQRLCFENQHELDALQLNRANLEKSTFLNCDMTATSIKESDFDKAIFYKSNLVASNIDKSSFKSSVLIDTDLNISNVTGRSSFKDAFILGGRLNFKSFDEIDLTGTIISESTVVQGGKTAEDDSIREFLHSKGAIVLPDQNVRELCHSRIYDREEILNKGLFKKIFNEKVDYKRFEQGDLQVNSIKDLKVKPGSKVDSVEIVGMDISAKDLFTFLYFSKNNQEKISLRHVNVTGLPKDVFYINKLFAHMQNAKNITMKNCDVQNVNFLKELPAPDRVKVLNVSGNPLGNLSAVSDFVNLRDLDASNTGLKDISPISKFTKMRKLNLANNKLVDVNALEGLGKLQDLNIAENKLLEISGLADKPDLVKLSMQKNPDCLKIGVLKGLTGLQELTIDLHDQLDNLLADHKNMKRLNISRFFDRYINPNSLESEIEENLSSNNIAVTAVDVKSPFIGYAVDPRSFFKTD